MKSVFVLDGVKIPLALVEALEPLSIKRKNRNRKRPTYCARLNGEKPFCLYNRTISHAFQIAERRLPKEQDGELVIYEKSTGWEAIRFVRRDGVLMETVSETTWEDRHKLDGLYLPQSGRKEK